MRYDGNYSDTTPTRINNLLEAPSRLAHWTLTPLFRRRNLGGTILYYHEIKTERFRSHVEYLRRHYEIVPLDRLVDRIKTGETVPDDHVSIVFDDGRRTIYSDVRPVVEEYEVPITVYLVTDAVEEGTLFWDKVQALEQTGETDLSVDRLSGLPSERRAERVDAAVEDRGVELERTVLNWTEIEELHSLGVDFQAHTRTHPSLPEMSKADVRSEITDSQQTIQRKLGGDVSHFSYPFGHSSDEVAEIVREEGFDSAVGVHAGVNTTDTDPYRLRRVGVEGVSHYLMAALMSGMWHTVTPTKQFRQ